MEDSWPPKLEEVFPLPPGLSPKVVESIQDGDTSLFEDACLMLPYRWQFTIADVETYSRVVGL